MKITLIHPPALMARSNYSTITQPHLGLAYIAAFVRERGHEVEIVDGVGEAISTFTVWEPRPDFLVQGLSFDDIIERVAPDTELIGLTCMFTHSWPMVRELAKAVKAAFPDIPLVAGGEHVTAMHELVLTESPVDACVLGEGEETFNELANAYADGTDLGSVAGISYCPTETGDVTVTAARSRIRDVDALPWPAWDLIDPMAYLDSKVFIGPRAGRTMPMLATRGCPYQCTYCASPQMWGTNWFARDVDDVINEMAHQYEVHGANDFQFQDLTTVVNKRWILSFCEKLIERGLDIRWQLPVGTRCEAIDADVAEMLQRSGCSYIQYAAESGSERILDEVKKKVSLEHLEQTAVDSVKAGITVCVLLMVGFPGETNEDVRKTFRLIRKLARDGIHEVAVSVLVPLPNTEMFRQLQAERKIELDDDYCYWMSGATTMTTARSWNPNISSRKLLFLKLLGLAEFYAISYALHPNRLARAIRNAWRGEQESKVDRVLREAIEKVAIISKLRRTAPAIPARQAAERRPAA